MLGKCEDKQRSGIRIPKHGSSKIPNLKTGCLFACGGHPLQPLEAIAPTVGGLVRSETKHLTSIQSHPAQCLCARGFEQGA